MRALNRPRNVHDTLQVFGGGTHLLEGVSRDHHPRDPGCSVVLQRLQRVLQQPIFSQRRPSVDPLVRRVRAHTQTDHVRGYLVAAGGGVLETKAARVGHDAHVDPLGDALIPGAVRRRNDIAHELGRSARGGIPEGDATDRLITRRMVIDDERRELPDHLLHAAYTGHLTRVDYDRQIRVLTDLTGAFGPGRDDPIFVLDEEAEPGREDRRVDDPGLGPVGPEPRGESRLRARTVSVGIEVGRQHRAPRGQQSTPGLFDRGRPMCGRPVAHADS